MCNLPLLRRRLSASLLLVLTLSACTVAEDVSDGGFTVVVTTTILGDVVEHMVGTDGRVEVLMPIGVDPHDFSISASQIAAIVNADLVIINGLGLEASLDDVFEAAKADGANIFSVGEEVTFPTDDGSNPDPHFWMVADKMAQAASLIATEIARIEPDGAVDWIQRGAAYAATLSDLEHEISNLLATVPPENRKLVTNHDSLGYLAEQHGFEIIGTVFPGRSLASEPSSEALTTLVRALEANNIRVIFGETTEPSQLATAVAAELGDSVTVVELFTGSLGGPGSGAETYLDLLRTNARLIAEALAS